MVHARRRLFLIAAALVVLVLLGSGRSFQPHRVALAVNEDANVSFDPLSPVAPIDPAQTVNPPRLYAGDLSHVLPARGIDNPLGTNGYCVTLNTGGIVPAGANPPVNLGFALTGTNPINPSAPATVNVQIPGNVRNSDINGPANHNALTGVEGPYNSPTVNGDKYCIVARAPVGYQTLQVSWTYSGGTCLTTCTVILNDPDFIPVVTVTLTGSSISNIGLVCTRGWDTTFLTGHDSDNPPVSPALPDPVNVVQTKVPPPSGHQLDFTVTVLTGGPATITSVQNDQTPGFTDQWCVSLSTPTGVTSTLDVSFKFDSVYNRLIPEDNQQHTVNLSDNAPPNNVLTITGNFQLAHIGAVGQVLTQQVSPPYVLGATERACILATDANDVLLPQDINFSDISGPPDHPVVSGLAVFHTAPADGISVPNGTICFRYSSTSAGEHGINAVFTENPGGIQHTVSWTNGPLIVQWNRIDETRITTSGNPDDGIITFGTITVPLSLNLADGTFLTSDISLSEFVLGSHHANGQFFSNLPLDGVLIQARIIGTCGFFVVPTPPGPQQPTTVTGTSVNGRFALNGFGNTVGNPDDLKVGITNDPGCTAGSQIRVEVDVFYPTDPNTPAKPTEFVTINFTFFPPNKTPRIAWIGDVVPITYSVSSNTNCEKSTVHFVRPNNQRGSFVASPGVEIDGSGNATADFTGCSATVNFVSVDPGEVDIEAFISDSLSILPGVTKVGFPIFYLALEDVTLTGPTTSVVSTVGELDAVVRGWFVGTNPSAREAETTADGRRLPAGRWVLPDDWSLLQGGDTGLRGNWGSPTLPPTKVTFTMLNANVVNGFKSGVKNGAAGWLMPFSTDQTSPETGRTPDAAGNVAKPTALSALTDNNGVTAVLNFGDKNLSFEGCAANAETGNPLCKPGDIVGHTTYQAVADYFNDPGKYPPITGATATTEWTWAGYRAVTIVPGPDPTLKFVVTHLRDRDGYCDAAAFNNELGVTVSFSIDSGSGVIIDAQGQPAVISQNKRSAVATTFDTVDDTGAAINQGIAKPAFDSENPDECQAWIEVSDSLLDPTNVVVNFTAPPAPIPGDIRITGLVCTGTESVTVKNFGVNTVNLAGFAIRSLPNDITAREEHLGLYGLLAPGQSATFPGGPSALEQGWLVAPSPTVFSLANDYARLVWNGFELDRRTCASGITTEQVVPSPLPLDGEGNTVIDVIIPYGLEKEVPLVAGWNFIGASGADTDLAQAVAGHEADIIAIYGYDAATDTWLRYVPGAPDMVNTLTKLVAGQAYWVDVKSPFTLTVMK